MDQATYQDELRQVLKAHAAEAGANLSWVLNNLPEKTRELHIIVMPDQDGEGTFSIIVSLDGPDLYVLNKAIRSRYELFSVRHTETGLSPKVPLLDPDEIDFEVNDAIVDTAADWVLAIWLKVGAGHCQVPAMVFGHDEWGTMTPIELSRGP